MLEITISEAIKIKCPDLRLGCLQCEVDIVKEHSGLWALINETVLNLQAIMTREHIATLPVIKASREAYRALGKDPARYRLSAEALLRRVLGGKSLYKINNVVDLLNLVSIQTGFSIGGFDTSQLEGNAILGIGEEGEPYTGIGRGTLNIANLPVLRDEKGAFGTPTSDSSRTLVGPSTKQFLMVFYDFGSSDTLEAAMELAESLLSNFGGAEKFEKCHI
ncbi:MAG: phenylalanine--tRNA ligase beta subunit-related protein [Bacteroidota bacterium]